MKYSILLSIYLLGFVFAQNTITGQVVANNTQGFVIIGCLIDLSTQDCNYEKSQSATVNQDGTYTLANLETGQYIVIAWRDTNGSGDLEEDQDEIGYYTDANGELSLTTAPASNITISVGNAATNPLTTNPPATANNPLSSTQAPSSNTIVGTWYEGYASSTSYQDSVTGRFAPPTGGSWNYTFNADGTYEYNFLFQNTFYSCTTTIFNSEEGSYVANPDGVLMLTQTKSHTKSEDSCTASSNYEKDLPLETEYFYFQLARDISEFTGEDLGEVLVLTDLILNSQGMLEPDPEDPYANRLSREP